MKNGCFAWLRLATHPFGLCLVAVMSIFLWMPFGQGYYGWPWEYLFARLAIETFVYAVPPYAAMGIIAAVSPKLSPVRLAVAIFALLVGLFGVSAMTNWLSVYSGPKTPYFSAALVPDNHPVLQAA